MEMKTFVMVTADGVLMAYEEISAVKVVTAMGEYSKIGVKAGMTVKGDELRR